MHNYNSGEVGTDLKYGFWLEYGTRQMEARPWLRPSLLENKEAIMDNFRLAIDKAIRAYYGS
jgi:hypothetical protein